MIKQLTLKRSGNNATCDILLQTLQLNTVSVASFPSIPYPAFCRLPFSKQQKVRQQPEKDATQSLLWILSTIKVAYTHEVQEHPSSCNLLGMQIQL